jgi:peptidoglycan hydrolase CwlO-like protein
MQESSINQTTPRRSGGVPVWLAILLVVAGCAITYFLVKNVETAKTEKVVETKNKEIDEISAKMKDLSEQLDEKIAEAKKLGADYKALEEYKNQLESDRKALQGNLQLSQSQLKQFQDKIGAYQQMITAKDKELAELKAKNQELTTQRDSLAVQKDSLTKEKERLTSTVSEVEESNKKLNAIASILRAENISVTAYNRRDKQESRNTFKAKNIDRLKVDLVIAENNIAPKGNREVFMRLVEPGGTVVFAPALGSGKFDAEDDNLTFTQKKQILYDNSAQNMQFSFDTPKDYDFKTGKYSVELFCDGKQIGLKTFEVK